MVGRTSTGSYKKSWEMLSKPKSTQLFFSVSGFTLLYVTQSFNPLWQKLITVAYHLTESVRNYHNIDHDPPGETNSSSHDVDFTNMHFRYNHSTDDPATRTDGRINLWALLARTSVGCPGQWCCWQLCIRHWYEISLGGIYYWFTIMNIKYL